jgi:hypothetical protein
VVAQFSQGGHAVPLVDQACGQHHAPRDALSRCLPHRCYGIVPDFGESDVHQGRKIHGQALG